MHHEFSFIVMQPFAWKFCSDAKSETLTLAFQNQLMRAKQKDRDSVFLNIKAQQLINFAGERCITSG
jgi:hypothetical protein